MIVQLRNRDGGDSFNRAGLFFFAIACYEKLDLDTRPYQRPYLDFNRWLMNTLSLCVSLVDGRIRRHPDESKWYGDWDRGSRDQLRTMIHALGMWHTRGANLWLDRMLAPLRRNWFLLSTNTYRNWVYKDRKLHEKISPDVEHQTKPKIPDYIGPFSSVWAAIIRAKKIKWLYPLLLILDIKLLLNSFHKFYLSDDDDVINHIQSLIHAAFQFETPFSFMARFILKPDMIIERLELYFEGEDSPEFIELYRPLLERFF